MSPGDKMCFSSKVFHLNVENHMARYLLVTVWRTDTIGQYFEGGSNIFHFGCNGIVPISVAILFVNLQCIFHGVMYFNSKLVVSFKVSGDAFLY